MLTLAHRMGHMDQFSSLMADPSQVDDPMLAAVAQACAEGEEQTEAWGKRLAALTLLS